MSRDKILVAGIAVSFLAFAAAIALSPGGDEADLAISISPNKVVLEPSSAFGPAPTRASRQAVSTPETRLPAAFDRPRARRPRAQWMAALEENVGPLDGLQFGMTREEAEQEIPHLLSLDHASRTHRGGANRLELHFLAADGSLSDVVMMVPRNGALLSQLTASWGTPTAGISPGNHVWNFPAPGVRGRLIDRAGMQFSTVEITQYKALDTVVASERDPYRFGDLPPLGTTRATLMAQFGNRLVGSDDPMARELRTSLPPTEHSTSAVDVVFGIDPTSNTLAKIDVELPGDLLPDARERALELLTLEYGPPQTTLQNGGEVVHEFHRDPSVLAVEPSPAAELVGAVPINSLHLQLAH